ncbi:hypothetical protein HAX54_015425 [Datura stramonium]|uniref:Uncharacterized protein n=1 Tax=Datura stramonium TaxID=4076 RepID=A0ABS8TRI9_DATST|nr:hypothetical protein [Datura stramonium]
MMILMVYCTKRRFLGGLPKYTKSSNNNNKSSSMNDINYDSIFTTGNDSNSHNTNDQTSSVPYDKPPVYDEDIFDGLPGLKSKSVSKKSASTERFDDDVFATMTSPPQPKIKDEHFGDLLGNLRSNEKITTLEFVSLVGLGNLVRYIIRLRSTPIPASLPGEFMDPFEQINSLVNLEMQNLKLHCNIHEAHFGSDTSQRSEVQMQPSDDVWLSVSEIPLFTQPTRAPPPSRPPPPIPRRNLKSEASSFTSDARKKGDGYSSSPRYNQYFQSPKLVRLCS